MPKDEFDFDDPLELNGVAIYTVEDTQRDMAECFVEEFLMLGHNHKQLLALFRNPHYLGMNMVLQNKGEDFVKEIIGDVFARWGKKIEWPANNNRSGATQASLPVAECQSLPMNGAGTDCSHLNRSAPGTSRPRSIRETDKPDEKLIDPFGNPIPKLNL
jgi:hypothetical protein